MSRGALALSAAIVVLAAFLGWSSADAHAVLLRATPPASQMIAQAPDEIQLLFSEPLDPTFSSIVVRNSTGVRADLNDSRLDANNDRLLVVSLAPGLPNGAYTVYWRSLSAIDVHPDEGSYRLFIGVPVPEAGTVPVSTPAVVTATPETTLGRWWFYLAATLFGGVLATWKLVIGRALPDDATRRTVRAQTHRLILLGGLLLLAGSLFTAVAQAAAAANVSLADAIGVPLSNLLLRGRFAGIWWPRMGLEVASLLLVAFGGIDGLASECALATLPAVLLTSALTSHGAALSTPGVGIVIDWLHIVGAAAWVGGLLGLLVCFAAMRPSQSTVKELVGRFARLGLAASALVLVSGTLQGALEVGSWDSLTETLYGQLILTKIVLLLTMLLLAGINELRARKVVAAAQGLSRGVGIEAGLGVVVFFVAAVLSGTPPSPR